MSNFSKSSIALFRLSSFFTPAKASGSSIFSRTVNDGMRLKDWNTNPMCFNLNWEDSSSFIFEESFPRIITFPLVGGSINPIILRRVDFPDPDFPLVDIKPPIYTSRFTPRKTGSLGLQAFQTSMSLTAFIALSPIEAPINYSALKLITYSIPWRSGLTAILTLAFRSVIADIRRSMLYILTIGFLLMAVSAPITIANGYAENLGGMLPKYERGRLLLINASATSLSESLLNYSITKQLATLGFKDLFPQILFYSNVALNDSHFDIRVRGWSAGRVF